MNIYYLILTLSFLVVTTSCVKDDYNFENEIIGSWNLIKSSGGISGETVEFDEDDEFWIFSNGELIIRNGPNSSHSSGIRPGIHRYSFIKLNGTIYLVIDGSEIGHLHFQRIRFSVDQTKHSDGSGTSDGQQYFFER